MKVAIWYDKKKPKIDLVYATTHKTDIELEKIVLDIYEGENIQKAVYKHLGIDFEEPQPDCGPDGVQRFV